MRGDLQATLRRHPAAAPIARRRARVFNLVRLARFINCRGAARLISAAQDRPLSLIDAVKLRLHLHWCVACNNYLAQVRFLRAAARRFRE